ncbi:MAG: hypothetical protein AAF725_23065 [Acidobacteriota bacterium]
MIAPPFEVMGLMPAAGSASRLGGRLPCSKEILPVGFEAGPGGAPTPRPVCHPMLRGWAAAGIERAVVVLRDGKWDVPAYLGSGAELGLDLAYLLVEQTRSVPETLRRATRWLGESHVALGFPDILLEPRDAWTRLLEFHACGARGGGGGGGGGDLSLGLFPTEQVAKTDMVSLEGERITGLVIKDSACTLRWTWSIALWTPRMTRFLERWSASREALQREPGSELWVGDVIRAAIESGLEARGLRFESGSFLDIGTPEDLRNATRLSSGPARGAAGGSL